MAKKAKTKVNPSILEAVKRAGSRAERASGEGGAGFFRPGKNSNNKVRILPGKDDTPFFLEVAAHWGVGPNDKRVTCPRLTNELENECAICEYVTALFDSGEEADRDAAKDLAANTQYWMNVIIRDHEDDGVMIWGAPPTVFNYIAKKVADPDYGEIWDEVEGTDFIVDRDDSGRYPNYGDSEFARYPSPIFEDEDEIAAVLLELHDFEDHLTIPSYEETLAALTGEEGDGEAEEEAEESEEESVEEQEESEDGDSEADDKEAKLAEKKAAIKAKLEKAKKAKEK